MSQGYDLLLCLWTSVKRRAFEMESEISFMNKQVMNLILGTLQLSVL